jgi:hypothetical protein
MDRAISRHAAVAEACAAAREVTRRAATTVLVAVDAAVSKMVEVDTSHVGGAVWRLEEGACHRPPKYRKLSQVATAFSSNM